MPQDPKVSTSLWLWKQTNAYIKEPHVHHNKKIFFKWLVEKYKFKKNVVPWPKKLKTCETIEHAA